LNTGYDALTIIITNNKLIDSMRLKIMNEEKSTLSKENIDGKSEWTDISYPLSKDMIHWPTSPIYPHIEPVKDPSKGDKVTMFQININVHNGTHIDAPLHFIADGIPIDKMPLDTMIGEARIIEILDNESIKPEELEEHNIQPGERILFKTRNSSLYELNEFVEDYVYISTEAAHFLKDRKVSVVGIDYFAVGSIKNLENLFEVHQTLLSSNIWIVEGLNLSSIKPGRFELICLPLKILSSDASPARAIIRPI
jgi:arylformamidase